MRVVEGKIGTMRTLCDACESAAAVLFCAADEASLCRPCDDKVHTCNKLASRHVRVGLADPIDVPRCEICENSPAFFYCEIDGTSLCLECDLAVHVGGKRTHRRYLLFRQRVEFPGDKAGMAEDLTLQFMGHAENKAEQNQPLKPTSGESQKNQTNCPVPIPNTSSHKLAKRPNMIDLNMKPHKIHAEALHHEVSFKP